MAKGSGGTRGAAGGGRSSGGGGSRGASWGDGGRGLLINGIEQETEKAIKINTDVSWNGKQPKSISLWVPKSAVAGKGEMSSLNNQTGKKTKMPFINVKDWFAPKMKLNVNYKGWEGVFNHGLIGERW